MYFNNIIELIQTHDAEKALNLFRDLESKGF